MKDQGYRFETQALHGGQVPDPVSGSRAAPLYRTTSYVFDSPEHAASSTLPGRVMKSSL